MSPAARRHLRHPGLILCGTLCLFAAASLGLEHVRAVEEVRQISVPLVAQLPQLERRLHVLSEQVELSELQSALRVGSQEERLHVYALPTDVDTDRTIALFEVLRLIFAERQQLTELTDLQFGERYPYADVLEAQMLSLKTVLHEDALQDLLSIIQVSGVLTIADALTEQERLLLLESTEQENPAGVVVLEQFLSTDLLDYALDPQAHEKRLTSSFASNAFTNALHNTLRSPMMNDARRVLGGRIGAVLKDQNLWPLPAMTLHRIHLKPGGAEGWYKVGLKVDLVLRES